MKRVFVCSPYRGRDIQERLRNVKRTIEACRYVLALGHAPFAPHLFCPRFLDEDVQDERTAGISIGLAWLLASEELWVFGKSISDGMQVEINRATIIGIPVIHDQSSEWE